MTQRDVLTVTAAHLIDAILHGPQALAIADAEHAVRSPGIAHHVRGDLLLLVQHDIQTDTEKVRLYRVVP